MPLKPVHRDVLLLLGWLQLQCGQPDRARILFEALLYVEPAHVAGRRALAVSLVELDRGLLAEHHCEQLMAEGETDPGLWLCLSRARQSAGRLDEARLAYESFLTRRESHEGCL